MTTVMVNHQSCVCVTFTYSRAVVVPLIVWGFGCCLVHDIVYVGHENDMLVLLKNCCHCCSKQLINTSIFLDNTHTHTHTHTHTRTHVQGEFTGPGNSVQLRILAYYLILFPSLDVMSAYPLNIHCAVNNLYMIITGRDTSKKPKWKFDWLLRLILRFIAALLPLFAALGVANLIYVLKYGGLIGFGICFFFPTILQLRSIFVCMKKFAGVHVSLSGSHTKSRGDRSSSPELKGAIGDHVINQEKSPLLSELEGKDKRHLYMTPYSSLVLSNPVFVVIVGVVGAALFVLTVVSLFIEPRKITCALRDEL